METTFGLRGAINPPEAVGDFAESFTDGPFQISINAGIIEIGFDNQSVTALKDFLSCSARENIRIGQQLMKLSEQ